MNLDGLNRNNELTEARKTCAFCNELFQPQESKTVFDDKFYHLECYDEMLYKLDDYIHLTEGTRG